VKIAPLAVLVALALVPAAEAKQVRVFAVGPRFSLDWVDTRAHFHDHLFTLARGVAERRLGPADPARPAQTARDLVALPEDLGLMAAFSGQRGALARGASDLTSAIVALIASYAPVDAYYAARFPGLLTRPFPPTRLLALALTDTFVHVAVESFSELAKSLQAYVVAGVTLAQDWRTVCATATTTAPFGCDAVEPTTVAVLRSPDEPSRQYAYQATSAKPSTEALVFDPTGKIVAKTVKAYLTPTELPGQLDLVPGDIDGVQAIPTPVGTLGIVTSKDAWMPDVIAKLDAEGAELLIQPEFFVNDTIRTTGPWAPDNIEGAGPSALLRAPSLRALVLPQLVGNVFDFSADAQQAIVSRPRNPRAPPVSAFVGQPATPGFQVVSPWVTPDPTALDFPARRHALGLAGEALLPGGERAGKQVEGVISADIQVGDLAPYRRTRKRRSGAVAPFAPARPLAPRRLAQRRVALAADGSTVLAVFEQDGRARLTRSVDGGATFGKSRLLAPGAARSWLPAVAIKGSEARACWQDDAQRRWQVRCVRSSDGGVSFGAALTVAPGPGPQWWPAVAVTGPGRAVVAWVDERARFAGEDLPQATLLSVRLQNETASAVQRLDRADAVAPLAATLDHAWAPSLAAQGDVVLVSWLDFRTYDWRVAARRSADGGATFGREQPVNTTPADIEALEDTPRAALGAGATPLVAFTDWFKDPQSNLRPSRLYDIDAAVPGTPESQVDDAGAAHVSAFAPALAAVPGGGFVVAWEDHRSGAGMIRARRLAGGGATIAAAQRVDDNEQRTGGRWRPAVAVSNGRAIVAWEDDRDGPSQIYVTRGSLAHLR
jgi:predicted amidohydrolase